MAIQAPFLLQRRGPVGGVLQAPSSPTWGAPSEGTLRPHSTLAWGAPLQGTLRAPFVLTWGGPLQGALRAPFVLTWDGAAKGVLPAPFPVSWGAAPAILPWGELPSERASLAPAGTFPPVPPFLTAPRRLHRRLHPRRLGSARTRPQASGLTSASSRPSETGGAALGGPSAALSSARRRRPPLRAPTPRPLLRLVPAGTCPPMPQLSTAPRRPCR